MHLYTWCVCGKTTGTSTGEVGRVTRAAETATLTETAARTDSTTPTVCTTATATATITTTTVATTSAIAIDGWAPVTSIAGVWI